MLADLGCRYVIVGHSERRNVFGESDELVALKFTAAIKHRLTPIFCVGETLAERESAVTEAVVARQLDAGLKSCGIAALGLGVIAYEPVWAIGTGKNATPADASAVHAVLRRALKERVPDRGSQIPILYGGSVNRGNAAALMGAADVDGLLVGGASLEAEGWASIVRT